jgi:hypothetical protein
MKSILDKSFRYTPAVETDLRKTFARIRRKQKNAAKELARRQHENALEVANKVLPIKVKP